MSRSLNPIPLTWTYYHSVLPQAEVRWRGNVRGQIRAQDFLAAILAIDDVIDGTGIFKARLARHEERGISLQDCQP